MLAYRVHRVATSFIRTRKEEASKEKGRIEAGEATQRPSIPYQHYTLKGCRNRGEKGGALCVQIGFYANIFKESRSNIEIKV